MKNILIPTDFSENSCNAIKYAISMFWDQECIFYFLNTYTPAIAGSRFMAASFEESMLTNSAAKYSQKGLDDLLQRVKKDFVNEKHSFRTISSFSLLVDEVVESIRTYDIDLVVMGTTGATGMEEVFMGSNAVRVIKSVKDCPVLAIPQNFEFEKPTEIAFATDFTRFYTKSELKALLELAAIFDATVRIVHVQYEIKSLSELQLFNLGMLRKYLGGVEHYVHTVSELNSVSKTLEVFSKEMDIHLLAMLNYQHSYMEQLIREPVVKRVAFHTQIPLLVIPELGMTSNLKESSNRDNVLMSN
ncbi:universal stress protein [Maribacter cobaltidurans]|uniref:Universal stress protein UspA n=1 Tax=Maribacter cobaltidurans TaxID=1178778 RepID=A0A223V2K3_9FLAO|nr:universal stress protein [Maribacter cobaltidurans]ASV29663.1 universal stress protein UspA [Maribacter cobaltidurans]GGD66982.1 universal stress protein UspA [Maribacter cobaltidurans]